MPSECTNRQVNLQICTHQHLKIIFPDPCDCKKTQSFPPPPKIKVVQEISKTQRAHDFQTALDKPGRLNAMTLWVCLSIGYPSISVGRPIPPLKLHWGKFHLEKVPQPNIIVGQISHVPCVISPFSSMLSPYEYPMHEEKNIFSAVKIRLFFSG